MAFRSTAAKLMLNKIGIVGGGNIGGVLAQECAKRNLAKTIGLMDIAVCSLIFYLLSLALLPHSMMLTHAHRSLTSPRGKCWTLRRATLL